MTDLDRLTETVILPFDHPLSRDAFLRRSLFLGAGVLLGSGSPLLLPGRARARSPVQWTLREKVAQLFVVSFSGLSPEAEMVSLLERHALGGVILYARNCHRAEQIRSLLTDLQAMARIPLLVCTDQEGGAVVRIRKGASVFPSEANYGRLGSNDRVYRDATRTAHELLALGLTMNLAPVVDVLANPKSPIGSRSYGPDPNLAARLASAAIRGYQRHGIGATAKHFIGLGHTSIDSDARLPTVTRTLEELERDDLIPFRHAVAAGVSTILVAHVALPSIDSVHRPASLSPLVINGLIRRRLGFRGVVMTDSLMMGALPRGHEAEAAERALGAGADILLFGDNRDMPAGLIDHAVERVVSAIVRGRITESRLDTALGRILALKRRYPPGQKLTTNDGRFATRESPQ